MDHYAQQPTVAIATGGQPKAEQIKQLSERHVDIVVASAGRLMDLIEDENIRLDRVSLFIVDEADMMFDEEWATQVREINKFIRPTRQTLMWSATWETSRNGFCREICREVPVFLKIGEGYHPCEHVEHEFIAVSGLDHKEAELVEFMSKLRDDDGLGLKIKRSDDEQRPCQLKVLIFFRTTRLVEATVEKLRNRGFDAFGSYSKNDDRAQTFDGFRSGEIRILLATDLFQRGIHIDGLTHVVNFDVPSPEREDAKAAYIHRVGRTGRLCEGKRTIGKALTFLDKRDKDFCSTLKSVFDEMDQFSGKELGTWQKDPKKKPVIDLLNHRHRPRVRLTCLLSRFSILVFW